MAELMVKCRCCGAELVFTATEPSKRCGFCKTVTARPKSQGDTLNLFKRATEQRLAKDFYHAEESYHLSPDQDRHTQA